ncbi:phosphotransferase family protein [Kitasatospora sp. NBC_01300]|uniref:phosphotransferase family protein n=1 Tax=Kitasatospora sp. NBC_01300 TaxID=2903574 RepID=UPI00352CB3A1|nr:aminoglycoside phosphotransferase family protein [Kitasatospora sp. NBC_01300]WSK08246.1 aminoglycoside phosphotransferase family protein [Kitasatospora sp. NBC_01300]
MDAFAPPHEPPQEPPHGPYGPSGRAWAATLRWVEQGLPAGHRVRSVTGLRGGWTSRMRRLDVGPEGGAEAGGYRLVLRSFVKPFYLRHAPALLTREAGVLRLLAAGGVPAARLHALDAAGEFCDHPSLVMSLLPGGVRVAQDGDVERRAELLAGQLAAVHALVVAPGDRPRAFEAWTSPERVRVPGATARPGVWRRAVDVIRREAPAYRPCFLHRDFHPGNVLFTGQGAGLAVSGVVDWVETSWGPADLDVAHCSTALALLHGVDTGLDFAARYLAAGGTLEEDRGAHLYWRLLDALAFAPDAEKVAVPWRELGRDDLTPTLLGRRLEDYLEALLDRHA